MKWVAEKTKQSTGKSTARTTIEERENLDLVMKLGRVFRLKGRRLVQSINAVILFEMKREGHQEK